MLKAIITYLNLKLSLLNYFDMTRCLCELKAESDKEDDTRISPKEYISNGEWQSIDFDAFNGVSYWRLRDEIQTEPVENQYKASKKVDVKIPLRLVFSVNRSKLTQDDAYSFDRIRETIVKQFNFDDGDLKTQLQVNKVTVSAPTANGNAQEVWNEETANTGTFEPKYEVVFGSIDIDVDLVADKDCLLTECDEIEQDILKTFDFCKAAVRDRLTSEQEQCLIDALCACADATVQVNGADVGTVASGGTYDQSIHDTAGTDVGTAANPSVIGDSSNEVNGVDISEPTVAEGTHNQQIHNSAASDVGTAANPSVVSDATVTINGDSLGATGDVVAEGSVDIDVQQGGAPVGSWDGSVWDVPASACGSTAAQLKTGQTVSYATGDDGDLQEGREVDFTTLNENNYFGNTNRFTDELGTQVYANNIAIDWSTYDQTTNNVTGWYVVKQSATPWATAITNCTSFSVGSFTSGWYLPNIRQYAQILDLSSTSRLNYSPFNITFGLLNSSTTYPSNTAQAWEGVAGGGSTPIFNRTKTINTEYLIARTFNTSEL